MIKHQLAQFALIMFAQVHQELVDLLVLLEMTIPAQDQLLAPIVVPQVQLAPLVYLATLLAQ